MICDRTQEKWWLSNMIIAWIPPKELNCIILRIALLNLKILLICRSRSTKNKRKKGRQISVHSFLHDILLTYHSFTMQWKSLYIIISKALTNFLPLLNIKDCLLCIACSFQKTTFSCIHCFTNVQENIDQTFYV